jgi:uncharacterized zinc-type alcohol dehydrogenase-like protein
MSSTCTGYAAENATAPLALFSFARRPLGPADVAIDILFCGVCHTDLHTARNEWGGTLYPCVPGHEIVGRVNAVGKDVTRFKVGDIAAVGCMVDSCHTCGSCRDGLEQFCEKGSIGTYNSVDPVLGGPTFGGYSSHVVVTESFVLRLPEGMDLAGAAPLLCAGITTSSPLREWEAGPGKRIGVVGLGGLGHMGSSSPMRWARRWCCSPRRPRRWRTGNGWAPTRWCSPPIPMRSQPTSRAWT